MPIYDYTTTLLHHGKEVKAYFIKRKNPEAELYWFTIIITDDHTMAFRMSRDKHNHWHIAERWCPNWIYDMESQLKTVIEETPELHFKEGGLAQAQ